MKKNHTPGVAPSENKGTQKHATLEPQFVVKTKGYSETFRNEADAKKQYDFLKKRSVKSQESIKIELSHKDESGSTKVLENVSIGHEFFD